MGASPHFQVMNEFELIRILTQGLSTHPQVTLGPGDDCAVVDLAVPDKQFLLKTDAVVENVHFTADESPEKVGRKALARALSDIAAMAGEPIAALVTLGLPAGFLPSYVESLYAGMDTLARKYPLAIVGGETTTSTSGTWISIALLGSVRRDRYITRTGAQSGDALFVTGELGGSIEGKHLMFEPRIVEARWLADYYMPTSMIDLSDGLAGDLRHLLRAQGLGAELLGSAIPVSRSAKDRYKTGASTKPPLVAAFTDGEDFELLFTVPKGKAVALLDAWKEQFPSTRLSCIGKIRSQPGIVLRDKTGTREIKEHGYVHFEKSE